jgi:tagatose 6-phosphate kinase
VIVVVTLNPAIDVTYRVEEITVGAEHRVISEASKAGGKGINVARVLNQLGCDCRVVGFVAGRNGEDISADLESAEIESSLIDVAGESRRTVTVTSNDGRATVFNEPGPTISESDFLEMIDVLSRTLTSSHPPDALVLTGSLPPGCPSEPYQTIGDLASASLVPVVLDASGEALLSGARARPALVKSNVNELFLATGELDPRIGAASLLESGAQNVVVTLGRDGMICWSNLGSFQAVLNETVTGNPTGAGDAATALLAARLPMLLDSMLLDRDPGVWPDLLAHAVAVSASSLRCSTAGEIDVAAYKSWIPLVEVSAL